MACDGARADGRSRPPSRMPWCSEGSGLGEHNVDDPAVAAGAEPDVAGGLGEQGVVVAAADVGAGVEVGTASQMILHLKFKLKHVKKWVMN